MKTKLTEIFRHYNSYYNLGYSLNISERNIGLSGGLHYNFKKLIEIGYKQVVEKYKESLNFQERTKGINIEDIPTFTLLHELGHALMCSANPVMFYKQYQAWKVTHRNNPLEISADEFAKQEIIKWK